jgi:D-glycero-alpha-D-manno-heptose-7-phosphate kinase
MTAPAQVPPAERPSIGAESGGVESGGVESGGVESGGAESGGVTVHAPARIMDLGGWTDTWFARRGIVCSIAVGPATTVVAQRRDPAEPPVTTRRSSGPCHWTTPDLPEIAHHPLLDAAAASVGAVDVSATIGSLVPPGAGLGTSASVLVALVAALEALGPDRRAGGIGRVGPGPDDDVRLAGLAHRAETSTGAQSGVQDQVAAACGGFLLIEIDYPHVSPRRLELPGATRAVLASRLLTVFFGRPHRSSDLHLRVIAGLEHGDAEPLMAPLREAALAGADALERGDLSAYADAVRANTAGQRDLHPDLIGSDARRLEEIVARYGRSSAVKVNGAGGEGGSATVLLPADPEAADALRAEVAARSAESGWRVLDLRPDDFGVMVRRP